VKRVALGDLHRDRCRSFGSAMPNEQGTLARKYAATRTPVVLTATSCFDWWKKMEKHDIRGVTDVYFGRQPLKNVRVGSEPEFLLRNPPIRPQLRSSSMKLLTLEDISGMKVDGQKHPGTGFEEYNATLQSFFQLADKWTRSRGQGFKQAYAQCSNSIEGQMYEAEITATGKAVLEFALDDTAQASRFGLGHDIGSKTVFWLNTRGSSTALHFDRTHNFIVQLAGHKRWTLYPPSEWPDLYFHPFLHERYDQSQVINVSTSAAETDRLRARFPALQRARSLTVDTFAGDVLYLPPFWATRVESVRDSMHLSVNSASLEQMTWARAYWKMQPYHSSWTQIERIAAFWAALGAVAAALPLTDRANTGSGIPPTWTTGDGTAAEWWEHRAADILHVGLGGPHGRYRELLLQRGRLERERPASGGDYIIDDAAFACYPHMRPSDSLMTEYAIVAAEMANDVAEVSQAILLINFLDLAEELILLALGSNDTSASVLDFVAMCLS